ncbi:tyrosine-type recombinase/integrase [Nitrospira defluvii]|uniref:Phage integrase n=1 Tax=Nitrospira defluvii TaxID=330214 RepID=A0ABM8R9G3_9BACT|nr:tyrosine-type recombinase/integrase [Nitrospira defluvii]CAE6740630.1 Putative phage integrase [Nitrospira defluvii]
MATTVTIDKGCLYRRKDRPTIYVKFTPRKGAKPIQLSTGKTNMIAAAAAAQVLLDKYQGKTPGQVKGQKLTIADFCRLPDKKDCDDRGGQFWQYLVGNRAGNTRNRHRDILKNQIIPTFGKSRFDDVEPEEIETWKQRRLALVKRSTVLKELHCLSAVFRVARKVYRYTSQNPVADIEKPTVPKRKQQIPTAEEMRAFLDAAALLKPYAYASLLTVYQGGLRIDEARHLEPCDVDEEEEVLRIRVKKGWSPKDQEDRDIPLVEPMRTVLLTLKHQNPHARWLLPRGDTRTYKCERCGGPETHIGNLRSAILSLATAAGISKRMTHHILRHCNSTHNRQLGAKDYEVMELLGQQSTKIHTIYTHAEWQHIVEATQRLGASIGGAGLSAWLSARPQEAEKSNRSRT